MTLRLNGATSGYVEIDCPAAGGNNTLVLPTSNGSNGNILGTDGAGNLSWVNGRMVLATSQASTSGTFVDFTGIPSWVKRVTVMFNGVSTNGTSIKLVQLGSGSFASTGYISSASNISGTTAVSTSSTQGFIVYSGAATDTVSGVVEVRNISSNSWIATSVIKTTTANCSYSAGDVTLSATLDRIRITTVNGTDTFDAGSINLLLEG